MMKDFFNLKMNYARIKIINNENSYFIQLDKDKIMLPDNIKSNLIGLYIKS